MRIIHVTYMSDLVSAVFAQSSVIKNCILKQLQYYVTIIIIKSIHYNNNIIIIYSLASSRVIL